MAGPPGNPGGASALPRLHYKIRPPDRGSCAGSRSAATRPSTRTATFAGYHGVGTDITERVRAAEQFRHLAHHDVADRPAQPAPARPIAWIRRWRWPGAAATWSALLLLDLDDFKIINDTDGHSAGDTVLVAIAQRLRGLVREIDTVARLGGDEFVILLQEMAHPRDAIRVAEKVIEAVREPVEVGGRQYLLGVSVGIAHFPEHAANMEGLMQKADIAMYEAKQAGGSRLPLLRRRCAGRRPQRAATPPPAARQQAYTLKRKCMTSPSCTT
jgi:diguanylate cyclase (GGDEF)-like protein